MELFYCTHSALRNRVVVRTLILCEFVSCNFVRSSCLSRYKTRYAGLFMQGFSSYSVLKTLKTLLFSNSNVFLLKHNKGKKKSLRAEIICVDHIKNSVSHEPTGDPVKLACYCSNKDRDNNSTVKHFVFYLLTYKIINLINYDLKKYIVHM